MAIYYKFKSAKDYNSITIDGIFISLINLKERIFESKRYGKGKDFDLIVSNAQTNEEYVDDTMLIPRNTSVVICRVPGLPRKPIVIQPIGCKVDTNVVDEQLEKRNSISVASQVEESGIDDGFGDDIYVTIPQVSTKLANVVMQESTTPTPQICSLAVDGSPQGRDFAKPEVVERDFGRGFGLRHKTPPQGYICHRCNIPGHYIQHCPTNGDPNFDLRKVKPATGIPKSMLAPTPNGSYVLCSGESAVLKPNESVFDKEIAGISSNRSTVELPPELHCPLCNKVMKDAVFTSKCCYKSFCDKCIRDYIISKSKCFCEAKDILADNLLPNMTVRDTINRILESGNCSAENVSSSVHVRGTRCLPTEISSPTQSDVSNVEQKVPPAIEDPRNVKESADKNEAISGKENIIGIHDTSKATPDSAKVKEQVSQKGDLPADEARQKLAAGDVGKKRKRTAPGLDGYAEPSKFDTHSHGMQPQTNGYNGSYAVNMPYNIGLQCANVMPLEPLEPHYITYPPMLPSQRKLAVEVSIGMNSQSPLPSKQKVEAQNADSKRNRETEREDDFRKHINNASAVSKHKPSQVQRSPSQERRLKRSSSERDRDHDRDNHHHRSSRSHRSNRSSLEQFSDDIPRSSLKRRAAQYELDHDYDRKPRNHHQGSKSNAALGYEPIDSKRPYKRMASSETWLRAGEETWRRSNSRTIHC